MIYDLSYILSGNLSDTEIAERQKEKDTFLKGLGIKVLNQTASGSRKLPYKIKNLKFGHFFDIVFEAENEIMKKIEKALSLDTDIVKYFVVKRKTWTEPKPKHWRMENGAKQEPDLHSKPTVAPAPAMAMTGEELDKKIDEILETPII